MGAAFKLLCLSFSEHLEDATWFFLPVFLFFKRQKREEKLLHLGCTELSHRSLHSIGWVERCCVICEIFQPFIVQAPNYRCLGPYFCSEIYGVAQGGGFELIFPRIYRWETTEVFLIPSTSSVSGAEKPQGTNQHLKRGIRGENCPSLPPPPPQWHKCLLKSSTHPLRAIQTDFSKIPLLYLFF